MSTKLTTPSVFSALVPKGRAAYLGLMFACVMACTTRSEPVRMRGVPLPEGGVVTSLAHFPTPIGDQTVVSVDNRLFVWSSDHWQRIASEGHAGTRSEIAGFGGRLVMLRPATISAPATLFSTTDRGETWERIPLPAEVRSAKASITNSETEGAASIRATDQIRLETVNQTLFLIHARNVWEMTSNQNGEPRWRSIDLGGLPFGKKRDSRLPPVISNYLNSRADRPFEIMSVLSEQLLLYRREVGEPEWTLVSTLPYADRKVLGTPNSEAIFVVADQSIHRSDDRGERWFQFWPIDAPKISAAVTVPDGDSYVLIAAGQDGSIWRSAGGGSWEQTVGSDLDHRAVHSFTIRDSEVLAASAGRGVLSSTDLGKSFQEINQGLVASRPFDLELWKGEPLVATVAGAHVWSSSSKGWNLWTPRAASSLGVSDENSLVIGTFSGDLLSGSSAQQTETIPKPFRDFQTVRFRYPPSIRGESAVLSIQYDDDGGRLVAWSARQGGAVLTGGAWIPLDLDKRLLDVLSGGTIHSFAVTPNAYFMLERTNANYFRLWRSDLLATRWAEVHRFDGAANIEIVPIEGMQSGLWLIEDGGLSFSSDGGETFAEVNGPWQAYRVVAVTPFESRNAIFAKTPRRIELYFIDGVSETPDFVNHPVLGTSQLAVDELAVAVDQSRIALATPDGVLVGAIPTAAGGVSLGASIALAALLGLILTALVFVIARSRGTAD